MPTESDKIELSEHELREIAGYAADCARQPDLAHHAAEATAQLILKSAGMTSHAIRNRHHSSHHQRPTKRPPRVTVPPQRSTLPSCR